MTDPRRCAVCGRALPPPSPVGRPAVYCTPRCRRRAEVPLRRLRHQIAASEAALEHLRRYGKASVYAVIDGPEAAMADAQNRIARLRAALAAAVQPHE